MIDKLECPIPGADFIPITTEDKKRIYQRWSRSIIVKLYGKTVRFKLLSKKLNEIWKPTENLQIIDLGLDFLMINFQELENYTKALHNGPWFINGHFLALQHWQMHFKHTQAKFSYTAIWIRLPELQLKFYDSQILAKIGNTIGKLLRMDVCTQDAKRGQYAQMCIEVPLDHQLILFVFIDKFHQRILYEGINLLCTKCGRIGHNSTNCASIIMHTHQLSTNTNPNNSHAHTTPDHTSDNPLNHLKPSYTISHKP